MSQTIEIGQAVLSLSAAHLELWLTTLITILPQPGATNLLQLSPACLLAKLSSGEVWIGHGHNMHIDLNITLQQDPLACSQRCELAESILRAPVWYPFLPVNIALMKTTGMGTADDDSDTVKCSGPTVWDDTSLHQTQGTQRTTRAAESPRHLVASTCKRRGAPKWDYDSRSASYQCIYRRRTDTTTSKAVTQATQNFS